MLLFKPRRTKEIEACVDKHMESWAAYGVESLLIKEGKIPETPPKKLFQLIKCCLIIRKEEKRVRKQMVKDMLALERRGVTINNGPHVC